MVPRSRLGYWLYSIAWPGYDCELCVGQRQHEGCYCRYYGCPAPNVSVQTWRLWLRRMLTKIFGWNGGGP